MWPSAYQDLDSPNDQHQGKAPCLTQLLERILHRVPTQSTPIWKRQDVLQGRDHVSHIDRRRNIHLNDLRLDRSDVIDELREPLFGYEVRLRRVNENGC